MASTTRVRLARAAILLGALWLLAGAAFKLFEGSPTDLPPNLREVLASLNIERGFFFRTAIVIELVVVIGAVMRPRWGWAPLAGMFAIFGLVLVPEVLAGTESCGCFGSDIKISPATMLGIDMTLLAAILLTRPWSARPAGVGPGWLVALLALLAVPLPFLVIPAQPVTVLEPTSEDQPQTLTGARWISLEPSQWIGQDIFETDLARYLDWEALELPIEGLFVFYRWTCDKCAEHMLQVMEHDDYMRPIVLVRVPEKGDTPDNGKIHVWPEGGHVTRVSLPRGPVWDITTPADLVVEGGYVSEARTTAAN